MSNDELQTILYEQVYQYARATTPVSLHPAVYYAHIASGRAGTHDPVHNAFPQVCDIRAMANLFDRLGAAPPTARVLRAAVLLALALLSPLTFSR
jgi:hypothetical protein